MSGSALYETFARAPLAFDHGEGTWLVTDKGEHFDVEVPAFSLDCSYGERTVN